jgi:hypothetical protein
MDSNQEAGGWLPIGRLAADRPAGGWPPEGRIWCVFFSYYQLVIFFFNYVPLIMEFTFSI